jgi:hypothetical protein
MEYYPSQEADTCQPNQNIPSIWKVHYLLPSEKLLTGLCPESDEFGPYLVILSVYYPFYITIPSKSIFSKWFFPLSIPTETSYDISSVPWVPCVPPMEVPLICSS